MARVFVKALDARTEPVGFILWGKDAKSKVGSVSSRHIVIPGAHPSPLSERLFRGGEYFTKLNEQLHVRGRPPIDWRLPADGVSMQVEAPAAVRGGSSEAEDVD